jgi:hypothetical protein
VDDECGQGLWYLEQRDRAGLRYWRMESEEMYVCRIIVFGKRSRYVWD